MSLSANQRRILKGLIHNFANRDKVEFWRMHFPRADATLDLMQGKGLIEIRGDRLAITRTGREAYRKDEELVATFTRFRSRRG